MARKHDIAILGATAAGWAAAARLAGKGLDVIVVDCPSPASESPLCDWAPRDFFRLPGLPKSLARACKASPFRTVRYLSADLSRRTEYSARSPAGCFLQSADLLGALRSAAAKAGAKRRATRTPPGLQLEEDSVRLLGATQVVARVLIITHSRPADVLAALALPIRTVPRSSCTVAGLDVPLGRGAPQQEAGGALHVVESEQRGELGMFFLARGVLHLRVVSTSAASGTRADQLSRLITSLQRAEIIPPDLPLGRAKGAVWSPPVAEALDMESHVAKRCLLAGTAGGFVDPISAHSLTPTVRSALVAADVAARALRSPAPQDRLMAFKALWRKKLVEYLRPPSTSLHLLLPLLFANKRLVTRFSRALLYGENI